MILVDSNIIIYHFNNIPKATDFLNIHRGNLAISTITVAEVLSFAPNDMALKMAEQFVNDHFIWLDVSREIILKQPKFAVKEKSKHLMQLSEQRHSSMN